MEKIKSEILRLFDEHNVDAMDLESLSILLALKGSKLKECAKLNTGKSKFYSIDNDFLENFDFKFQEDSHYPMFRNFSVVTTIENMEEFKIKNGMIIKTDIKTVNTTLECTPLLPEQHDDVLDYFELNGNFENIYVDPIYHTSMLELYQIMIKKGKIDLTLEKIEMSALERLKFKRRFK